MSLELSEETLQSMEVGMAFRDYVMFLSLLCFKLFRYCGSADIMNYRLSDLKVLDTNFLGYL